MGLLSGSNDQLSQTRSASAFYASRPAAEQAKAAVVETGVSIEAVKITDGRGTITGRSAAAQPSAGGLPDTLKNAFAQDAPSTQAEESRHGVVLTAHVPATHFDRVLEILGREGEISETQG